LQTKITVEEAVREFLKVRDGSILAVMLSSKSKTPIKMRARACRADGLPRPLAGRVDNPKFISISAATFALNKRLYVQESPKALLAAPTSRPFDLRFGLNGRLLTSRLSQIGNREQAGRLSSAFNVSVAVATSGEPR
jgi:hypothetical protein